MANKEKVLVIMGGTSTEREVSLRSGAAVAKALSEAGYEAIGFDVQPDNVDKIKEISPDVAFLALHGKGGEDGTIQGLLEWMNIPYTGPKVSSSAICMDKNLTKKVLRESGVQTPDFMEYEKTEGKSLETVKEEVLSRLGLPVVVKSPSQGSSIGVVMVNKEEDFICAIE